MKPNVRLFPAAIAVTALWTVLISVSVLFQGCAAVGRNPSPPSKLEQGLFDVKTNYVPIVQVVTNTVPVTVFQTNVQGVVTYQTNLVTVTQSVTNLAPAYSYSIGAGGKEVQGVASGVGALFGAGGIASTAAGLLLSLWGWARSSKNYATAANTVQLVEVIREFVKALPNGAAYDTALTSYMTQHQADAGVLTQVLGILAREVNNPDAKQAASEVITTINSLANQPGVTGTVKI